MAWQPHDAKNRLSEVVRRAATEGPQFVTIRDEAAAVVTSAREYEALNAGRKSLVDHLLLGSHWDDDLVEAVNDRAKTPSRSVEF
jgi:prevent-host-death family protein